MRCRLPRSRGQIRRNVTQRAAMQSLLRVRKTRGATKVVDNRRGGPHLFRQSPRPGSLLGGGPNRSAPPPAMNPEPSPAMIGCCAPGQSPHFAPPNSGRRTGAARGRRDGPCLVSEDGSRGFQDIAACLGCARDPSARSARDSPGGMQSSLALALAASCLHREGALLRHSLTQNDDRAPCGVPMGPRWGRADYETAKGGLCRCA
jgi:hypothetical protein